MKVLIKLLKHCTEKVRDVGVQRLSRLWKDITVPYEKVHSKMTAVRPLAGKIHARCL